ncbi:peptidyl-prolyl cis-trans isomerase A (cyclophilin A) [Sphingomonas kyeonggiensis]|uniref:peptidylprolyl isomerase n=1 Tax=Sphingomonas kyeonggiensis TaxID=1268553 RepID=A0A7W7NRQ5_9SPHN|nr:peptidylprolyl isomerase [Sphingomonas kyeonggiensis]MBB4839163.1 peptidyl-prolyl cis-trans isomerase A (cyclophilin A) [Sphingomonas kyeonggiensis]
MRILVAVLALFLTAAAGPQQPATVRVRLVTSAGNIVLALDARRAPKTVANFMAYVDDGRLDGTQFYRSARRKGNPGQGFVQGGIGTDARRMLPSPPLESTLQTGIRHLDATISMAHGPNPDGANCNFSIMVGPNPGLDAKPGYRGFAAFGKVVTGMDVVKRMLAMPTGGGRDAMKGQMILKPVQILRAERLDGVARPTGYVKPWLIGAPR